MGKSTPSQQQPQAPDPAFVSGQQTASNVNTAVANAYLNRVNQTTPGGTLTYNKTGSQSVGGVDVPTWEAITKLSPEQQRLYDTTQNISQGTADLAEGYVGRIGEATSQPFSYEGLPGAPTYDEAYRQKTLGTIMERNQPQMDRDRDSLIQRLANQGISQGSEAYRGAFDQYDRGVNDFRLGADVQAGGEAARQFGLEATTRDRAISERSNLRSQPINEVAALLGTGSGVQGPQFADVPQTQVAPTDVSGNYNQAYQAQMANYLQQQQMAQSSNNATTGGLFGLGSTVLGAGLRYGLPLIGSDRRLKENIRHIGHTNDGQKLYAFNYIGLRRPEIGLMADEVEKVRPEAVHEVGGFKYVDYAMALSDA